MCDCIQKTTEKLKEKYPDAERVNFVNQEFLSGQLYSSVEIHYPGKKKPETLLLLHTFCPICGERYKKDPQDG